LEHRVGCLSEALGAFIFVLVIALNAVALAAVAWGVQSSSGAALLGAVAASPWAYYFGTDAGPWAYLIAMPEFLLFTGLGWFGFRREARQSLRWLGAIVPTLIVIYAVVAPFVRV
jgi:hypothetical protein